jgi:hypothetical protein
MRWLLVVLSCVLGSAGLNDAAQGGCWSCRHHGSYGSSYGSATPAAPAAQAVAAPIYYQPVMMAPVAAAPGTTQAQFPGVGGIASLLALGGGSELGNIVQLLKIVQGLRDRHVDTDGGSNPSGDLASVLAALKRLEDGQEYLKGQHINTAAIVRAIGEQLVAERNTQTEDWSGIEDELKALNDRLDATSPLMEKLNTIEGKLRDLQDALDEINDDPVAGQPSEPDDTAGSGTAAEHVLVSRSLARAHAPSRGTDRSDLGSRIPEQPKALLPYAEKRR